MGRDQEKFTIKLDYDVSDNLIYVGKASRSSSAGNTVWRIQKLSYDGSNNLTDVQWANGSKDFSFEWDERTTYTYS